MKDQYFSQPQKTIPRFEFNQSVADCFDDMVSRSVPNYENVHHVILEYLSKTAKEGFNIYDLGCSTGTTLSLISDAFSQISLKLFGIDSSQAMIEKAQQNIRKIEGHDIRLTCADLREIQLSANDLTIMNYTLQFIEQSSRTKQIETIYKNLNEGGAFILSEKVQAPGKRIQNITTELYYDFKKRNGYSQLEIAQKREALENFLIPESVEDHFERLKNAGFSEVDLLFKQYNFATFIAVK